MVKGENDGTYLKLKERLYRLMKMSMLSEKSKNSDILDLIFEVGLNNAMKNYKI
jgi:hypothetical protein